MFNKKDKIDKDNLISRKDYERLQSLLKVHQDYLNNLFVYYTLKPTYFLEKFRNVSYELLKFFDNICIMYGIEYWLDFGTLLGAVRHGDFIPWDDNLNVGMFRKDYIKFSKIIDQELNNLTNFKVDNEEIIKIHYINSDIDDVIVTLNVFPYDFTDDSEHYCLLGTEEGLKNKIKFDTADLLPLIKIKFGKYSFSSPLDSHKYLKNIYGNKYSKIPKKRQKYKHLIYLRQIEDIEKILNKSYNDIKKTNENYDI